MSGEEVSVSGDAGFTRETSCRDRYYAKCEHLSGDALVPEDGHLNNRVGFGAELGEVSVPSASGVPDGRVAYVHPDGRGVYAVPGSDEAGNLLDLGFAEREEVVSVSVQSVSEEPEAEAADTLVPTTEPSEPVEEEVSGESVGVSGDASEVQVSVQSVSEDADPTPDPEPVEAVEPVEGAAG